MPRTTYRIADQPSKMTGAIGWSKENVLGVGGCNEAPEFIVNVIETSNEIEVHNYSNPSPRPETIERGTDVEVGDEQYSDRGKESSEAASDYKCRCGIPCEAFDPDKWMRTTAPPKKKKTSLLDKKARNLSPRDLKAVHSKCSKKALEYLRSSDQVACEIPSDVLKDELNAQFNCDQGPVDCPNSWPKCSLAVDEINRPFQLAKVTKHC